MPNLPEYEVESINCQLYALSNRMRTGKLGAVSSFEYYEFFLLLGRLEGTQQKSTAWKRVLHSCDVVAGTGDG